MPPALRQAIEAAPAKRRDELPNSGWVRHTVESAVWGLLTTDSFEDAVVQVVNLGGDADTAGAVTGALAGAAYGLPAIPAAWRAALHGAWPLRSGSRWDAARLVALADQLAGTSGRM
jgi:ADP-ribosyl-[dinitrogen reductase] hydrolase